LILSYSPNPKTTIYALGGYSPFWQASSGAKYQIAPDIEIELLYTAFTNKFLRSVDGDAATYNLGLRFSLF